MKLNYIKILLTGILLTLLTLPTLAQRSNGLTVQGTVSVEEGSVEGAYIQMYRDGQRLDNYGIGSSGRYKVELNYNHEFTLIFARDDNFPQKIVVNANVPRNVLQSDPLFPPFTVDINLFTEIPDIDKTFSENTVLKIYYSTDVDNFISEVYYNNAQIKHLIDQAILQSQMIDKEADYLATLTKAEREELQKEYDNLLDQAEEEYNNEQFLNALDGYKAASRILPKEQYPKDRIAEINDLLGLLMVAEEMQQALADRLESLLKQGDLQFEREQFEDAKNSYQRALSINSENEHAKNRVKEINQILNQKRLNQRYEELITQADNAFDELLYKEAKTGYEQAIAMKQNEAYPKERLEEVNNILSSQAENAAQLQSYKDAIFQAELNFEKQFYEEAISFYEKALTLKPGDEIATTKIQEIKDLMFELANRTLYDKLIKSADRFFKREQFEEALADYQQAVDLFPDERWPNEQISKINEVLQVERDFGRLISQADVAFDEENYRNSKEFYQQALEIKPEDEHATDRIAQIDEILSQQQLNEQYAGLIAEADKLFDSEELNEAKAKYQQALSVNPGEKYPEDRLDEINKIFEDRALLEERYQQVVASADDLFQKEQLEEARSAYENASGIKPSESYPPEMMQRIDSLIEEKARLLAEQKAAEEAAEEARLEAEANARDQRYQQIVDEADQMINENELVAAIGKFREALDVKPQEQYPIVRIEEIRGIISRQQEAQETYENAIAQADREFQREEFDAARAGYNDAKEAKPEETYPDEMLAQIDSIVETRARLAAEAEAAEQARLAAIQAEKDRNYNANISSGDSLFKLEEYELSRTAYRDAMEVKPEEDYPQQRIDEIGTLLAQLSAAQEAYENAIAQADRDFRREEFDAARTSYNDAKQAKPEETYPDEMLAQIDSIVETRARLAAEAEAAEQARLAAIQAEKDRNYNAAISSGDSLFNLEEYETSRTAYRDAMEVKPEEDYPQQRIDEIGTLLAQLSAAQEAYENAIAQADRDFRGEEFDAARTSYNDAKQAKPEETYPDEMLAQIDSIVETRARLAAEAEAAEQARLAAIQAEKDRNYNAAISSGDSLFNLEEYETSRTAYRDAMEVKPEEDYPQQRIDEIDSILSEFELARLKQEQLDRDYQNAIRAADQQFEIQQYTESRSSYTKASELKPDESYPKEKISAIDSILEQRQIDEQYRTIILAADGFFRTRTYDEAKSKYEEALNVKPEEDYPKNQIAKIDDILREEQERLLAEQQAAENLEQRRQQIASQQEEAEELEIISEAGLNDLYNEYIQRADQFFDDEAYNVSRAWYYRALDVKPKETYPPERIAEIKRILDGLLLSQRDRDYQQFIDLADSTFRENQLAVARGWYNRALSIKSNEQYPRTQLQEIQKRIEERMASQSGELFNEHVKKGDDAYESQNFNVARFWYKKALELRPNDEEVKNKMMEIQEQLN